LLVYALYGCAMLVRAVHKLLKSQANLQFGITAAPAQKTVATIPVVPPKSGVNLARHRQIWPENGH
jgi:hypothetical protein